jgi:protein-disulfide isomerase-like protein with CxxC motif
MNDDRLAVIAEAQEAAYARGRDEERAAVVALLEKDHGTMVANRIRRGEHWAGHECSGDQCEVER